MERSRARTGGPQPHNPAAIGIHRTGAAQASAPSRSRLGSRGLDARRWQNLGLAGLAWFLLIAFALTAWFVVVVPLRADVLDNDLTLVYIGARIGVEHGWSHIYSLALQHQLFAQLRPHATFNDGERFVSPPPFAWLVLPLASLGPAVATYAWLVISAAALAVAWWVAAPGGGPTRALWLLAAAAWYPVLYGFSLAQPDLVLLMLVAVAWRLAEGKRDYAAGALLGLTVIKPQLVMLLPLVLVIAGRWRIVAAWAGVAAALAAVSLLVVGGQGLNDYLALLGEAQHVANNRYFTLAWLVGPGPIGYVAQGLIVALAVVGAHRNRDGGDARMFALGIVATALGATYWHLQDFTVLVLAAWLCWRDGLSTPMRMLLLLIAVAGEFAWPLTPLPILLGTAIWLAALITRRQLPATAAA